MNILNDIYEKQELYRNFNISDQEEDWFDEMLLSECRAYPMEYERKSVWFHMAVAMIIIAASCALVLSSVLSENETGILLAVIGFVIFFAYIIKHLQFDRMKQLTQYFRDEKGDYYKVVFTQGASVAATAVNHVGRSPGRLSGSVEKQTIVERNLDEAQKISPAFYYVQRYKRGIKDWDPINGGLAKVKRLENLHLIKRGSKNNVYSCFIDGKKKRLKISNDYRGLADEFSH